MTIADIMLIPIYVLFIFGIGLLVRRLRYDGTDFAPFFLPALGIKVVGALLFCAVYGFYYEGDANVYYKNSASLAQSIVYEPGLGLEVFFSKAGEHNHVNRHIVEPIMHYQGYSSTFMVVRFGTVLCLLGMGSYWTTTMLLSALSFLGSWALFKVFSDVYPSLHKQMFAAVFCIPSVFFWGSGLLKDTISFAMTGWLVYGLYHLLIKRDKVLLPLVAIPVSAYFIEVIKAYILIGMLPPLCIWLIMYHGSRAKEPGLKFFFLLMSMAAVVAVYLFARQNVDAFLQYAFAKFFDMVGDFHSWHGYLARERGQTGYSLGEMELTLRGILSKFPAAVNVTLFRPYLHEATNPIMLVSAVESGAILLFSLYVLFKVGVFGLFRVLFSSPFLMFCFTFAMLFAFAVGISTYNFGALVRYKIPCLPFYIASLSMLLRAAGLRSSAPMGGMLAKPGNA